MTEAPAPAFYGRADVRRRLRALLERRSGGRLGLWGVGGVGKSALLDLFAVEARAGELPITPYVVQLDLDGMQGAHDLAGALLEGLAATGQALQRRWLLWREDSLAPARAALQSYRADLREATRALAQGATGVAPPDPGPLLRLLQQTVRGLPVMVRPPKVAQGPILPKPLLVLLCDNLERAAPPARQALRDLWSGPLEECCLLICAGRDQTLLDDKTPALELKALSAEEQALWLRAARIDDPALRGAIGELCQGLPLLLALAVERVQQARAQGRELRAADFAPDLARHTDASRVVQAWLVGRYLEQLAKGDETARRQARLLRQGCVLRRCAPAEALTALGIVKSEEADRLLHALTARGFLSARGQIHPLLRRASRAYLAAEHPDEYADLLARLVGYYERQSEVYQADLLYARLLRRDPDAPREVFRQVRDSLGRGDQARAAELLDAARDADPDPAARWWLDLAASDLALAQGRPAEAGALWERLTADAQDSERQALLLERVGAQVVQISWTVQVWYLRALPPSPELLQQAIAIAEATPERHHQAARARWMAALDLARHLEDRTREGRALRCLGDVAYQRDDLPEALRCYTQALDLFRAINDRQGQADALQWLGEVALQRGDMPEALRSFTQALDLFRATDGRRGQVSALRGLGRVMHQRGDLPEAQRSFTQALDLSRSINDRQGQASALRGLGYVALQRGNLPEAQRYNTQALNLFRSIDNHLGQANALDGLGDVARQRADLPEALRYYTQALDLYRATGERLGQAYALHGLGNVALQRDNLPEALRSFTQALDLFRDIDHRQGQANALDGLGDVALRRSHLPEALRYYTQALDFYRTIDDRLGQANSLRGLGEVALQRGDLPEALRCLTQALDLYRTIDEHLGQANALRGLGEVALAQRQPRAAREQAEQARALSEQIDDLTGLALVWGLLRRAAEAEGDATAASYALAQQRFYEGEVRKRR